MTGRVHSFQSMGAVDGPGVRFVVFLQGCPLRCAYCHNPDTWDPQGGSAYTPEAVCEKIVRCRPYLKHGGVTVSGGEPLLQAPFVAELFRLLRGQGLHTALDTSGTGNLEQARAVLAETDLVLCDLKFADARAYRAHCGASFEQVLQFLSLTEAIAVPLWVRHVVAPGLTDDFDQVREIARIARRFSNLEKLELLPFRKLCAEKYERMGIPFPLKDTPEMEEEALEHLLDLLKAEGLLPKF
ncbi:MAG: pyruvate formate-lyase-activating protein [Acutalibacteraceae bacterium]